MTPPVGYFLAGYGARTAPSTRIYHPLTATVIILRGSDTDVMIVSVEWLGFYEQTASFRQAIHRATGVSEANILLLGTHTHCGSATRGLDAQGGTVPARSTRRIWML